MIKSSQYSRLSTERPHPATRHLDRLSAAGLLAALQGLDRAVAPAVAAERPRIAKAVELLSAALLQGRRIYFVGAGTSGRLGVIEAAECPPTFGTAPSQVQAIIAGGRSAVFRPKEGAEDDAEDGRRQVRRRARKGDVVVGVAASGVTPFTLGGLKEGRRLGCATVLVTSNKLPALQAADVVICPRVGAEGLSGSTRMKSGTAAKMVLNQLTTAAMVRSGRAYMNWMVDLRPGSRKLRVRSLAILAETAGLRPAQARAALRRAGGHVKTAILMARKGLSLQEARKSLKDSRGFLRAALGE